MKKPLSTVTLVLVISGIGMFTWLETGCVKRDVEPKKENEKHENMGHSMAAPQEKVDFYLAVTGEEFGYLEPCGCSEGLLGGIMRRDSSLRYHQRGKTPVLALANGDLIKEQGPMAPIQFRHLVEGLNQMDYQVMNLGDRDLSMGVENLKKYLGRARFKVVTSNLYQNKKPLFSKEAVLSVGKKAKIAVFGLLASSYATTAELYSLRYLQPKKVLARLVKKWKKTDLQVVLWQGSPEEMKQLAQEFPDIDLWLASHQSVKPKVLARSKGSRQLIISQKAKYITYIQGLLQDRPHFGKVKPAILDDLIPDSPRMSTLYQQYVKTVRNSGLSQKLANIQKPAGGGAFVGSKRCYGCHQYAAKVFKETKHSHAIDILVEKGQHKNPSCLKCHTVGYGYVTGYVSQSLTPHLNHVGCESCHGPGENHVKNPQKGYGRAGRGTCLQCHTKENSPKFDFLKYHPKIKHLNKQN